MKIFVNQSIIHFIWSYKHIWWFNTRINRSLLWLVYADFLRVTIVFREIYFDYSQFWICWTRKNNFYHRCCQVSSTLMSLMYVVVVSPTHAFHRSTDPSIIGLYSHRVQRRIIEGILWFIIESTLNKRLKRKFNAGFSHCDFHEAL